MYSVLEALREGAMVLLFVGVLARVEAFGLHETAKNDFSTSWKSKSFAVELVPGATWSFSVRKKNSHCAQHDKQREKQLRLFARHSCKNIFSLVPLDAQKIWKVHFNL